MKWIDCPNCKQKRIIKIGLPIKAVTICYNCGSAISIKGQENLAISISHVEMGMDNYFEQDYALVGLSRLKLID